MPPTTCPSQLNWSTRCSRNPAWCVDMSGLAEASKADYVHRLRSTAEAHREQYGFPHWVIFDEAHLLGTERAGALDTTRRLRVVLFRVGVTARKGDRQQRRRPDARPSRHHGRHRLPTSGYRIRFGSAPTRPFTIADRLTTHVRHRHKYADITLPHERRFYFHTTDGIPIAPAATMHDFSTAVKHLDQQALEYHLERGDFSHWLDGTIADRDLAMKVATWEDELEAHRAADLERIRDKLIRAVEERYSTASEHR